jgi:hypothetical protein
MPTVLDKKGPIYICHYTKIPWCSQIQPILVRAVRNLTAGAAAGDFGAVECGLLAAGSCRGSFVPDQRHDAVCAVAAQPAAGVAGMALPQHEQPISTAAFPCLISLSLHACSCPTELGAFQQSLAIPVLTTGSFKHACVFEAHCRHCLSAGSAVKRYRMQDDWPQTYSRSRSRCTVLLSMPTVCLCFIATALCCERHYPVQRRQGELLTAGQEGEGRRGVYLVHDLSQHGHLL